MNTLRRSSLAVAVLLASLPLHATAQTDAATQFDEDVHAVPATLRYGSGVFAAPDIYSERLAHIPGGTSFLVLSWEISDWWKVQFGDVIGYTILDLKAADLDLDARLVLQEKEKEDRLRRDIHQLRILKEVKEGRSPQPLLTLEERPLHLPSPFGQAISIYRRQADEASTLAPIVGALISPRGANFWQVKIGDRFAYAAASWRDLVRIGAVTLSEKSVERLFLLEFGTFREQQKQHGDILILGAGPGGPNAVSGVDVYIGFESLDERRVVKYAYFTTTPFNAVGDSVNCSVTHRSTARLKATGPIQGTDGPRLLTWENTWYNPSITCVRLDRIEIEYMDGSRFTLVRDLPKVLLNGYENSCAYRSPPPKDSPGIGGQ
jgi:hypothetical protein